MLDTPIRLDLDGLLRNLRREGTPSRVFFMELFLDAEVQEALCQRFGLTESLDTADPWFAWRRQMALQRFLGYETVRFKLPGLVFPRENLNYLPDTALLARESGRRWVDETRGVIASWADFARYPWPEPRNFDFRELEWLERNLPEDMTLYPSCHQILEQVTWLMSYQGLSFALYDQPDLVEAMFRRVGELHVKAAEAMLQFNCVRMLFGGDDMGFKTGLMIPARVLVDKVFPWHARMAEMAHACGKLYLLHSCGKLDQVMTALIEQVKIDGRHSFEDAIEPITEAKNRWGSRLALLGGIDVDLLCRGDDAGIRRRVRETLDRCLPGGGFCLGTGNSVANYVPLDNYLAMLDEGRRFAA